MGTYGALMVPAASPFLPTLRPASPEVTRAADIASYDGPVIFQKQLHTTLRMSILT
jgi:hypothetical protein